MAPRKKNGAGDTSPAQLTEDNIDELDDEAFAAAVEAMDAEMDQDTGEDAGAAPEPSEAKETAKPEKAEAKADADKPEEAKADDGEDDDKQDFVPHGRFHNERERRKAAEQRAEAAQKRFDEFMTLMKGRQKEPEQAKAERPKQEQWIDPRKDIFGAYEQLRKGYEALVGHTNQQYQQTEQERQTQAALQESDADIISYVEEVPEAEGALEYLRNSRQAELAAMGFGPQEQRQDLLNIQVQFAQMAKQRGVRVGKLLHDLAVARGYHPKAPAPEQTQKPTASAKDPSKLLEDVNRLEATKQRAQSLGGSGAPVELSEITSEDIMNMSDADYRILKKKLEEQGKDIMDIGFGEG